MALWVEQHKGNEGPQFIAGQIAALKQRSDQAGIDRWQQIADAYARLQDGPTQ